MRTARHQGLKPLATLERIVSEGTTPSPAPFRGRSCRDSQGFQSLAGQAGYNLVLLMVLLTVLNIVVAASLPAWSAVIRRDKEEELVFRGLQYAEAIRVFQIRFQRPPVRLEELIEVEPRSIRRLWKDPMTKDGKWTLIPLQGMNVPPPPPDPNGRDEEKDEGPNDEEPEEPEDEDDGLGPKEGDEVQVGPFKGVRSRSRKTSFLVFNGKDRYDEWHFTVELFTGQGQLGGDPNNIQPQLSARWIGRPFPAFLQPPQGSGLPQDTLNDDQGRDRRRRNDPQKP